MLEVVKFMDEAVELFRGPASLPKPPFQTRSHAPAQPRTSVQGGRTQERV